MVAPLKVGIAGLGTVGAEVVRLIESQSRALSARCGRGVKVVAVSARSKVKKRGLDLRGLQRCGLAVNRGLREIEVARVGGLEFAAGGHGWPAL